MTSLVAGDGAPDAPSWRSASALSLLGANAVPVLGVLLGGWTVGDVMLLFWAESGVVGLYNIAKMVRIGGVPAIFMALFFCVHYGGFMAGHLVFIYAFFVAGPDAASGSLGDVPPELLALWPALLALLVSHGVSHFQNFLGRREYEGRTLGQQMHAPYRRIIVMHVTIILGGMLTLVSGRATWALLLLMALKIAADLHAHRLEHRRSAAAPA